MTLYSLVGSRWARWVVLVCAIGLTTALGVLGAGHGGRSQTNLDMRFLYLAGVQWHQGLSAYAPIPLQPVDPWLAEALGRYDFAYPPQIAPLCLLLARFSPPGARDLMTGLNVAVALMLAAFSARLAREPEPRAAGVSTDASNWMIPAIVLGNFSTAFVIWAGQTTLIVTLALMLGWHYARRDRWLIGGLLLAISTIKPQVSLLAILWLLLERRWRALAAAGLGIVALATVPMMVSGLLSPFVEWLGAARGYASGPYNTLGSRMIFGLGNLLHVAGIDAPNLLPVAILLVAALWHYRASIADQDILGLLVGLSLLFGFAHGYDIVALTPLVPAFWRHVRERAVESLVALSLVVAITLPNSLLEPFGSALLLHLRVVALLGALAWLLALSIRRPAADIGAAGDQRCAPCRL